MELYKLQQEYFVDMLNRNIFEYNKRHRDYFKIKYSFVNDRYEIDHKFHYENPKKRPRES
jgi:hypothetical protein